MYFVRRHIPQRCHNLINGKSDCASAARLSPSLEKKSRVVDDRVVPRPSLDSSSAADGRRGWKYRSAIFHAKIALVLCDSAIIRTPNRKVLRATVTMTVRRAYTGCPVRHIVSSLYSMDEYTSRNAILSKFCFVLSRRWNKRDAERYLKCYCNFMKNVVDLYKARLNFILRIYRLLVYWWTL